MECIQEILWIGNINIKERSKSHRIWEIWTVQGLTTDFESIEQTGSQHEVIFSCFFKWKQNFSRWPLCPFLYLPSPSFYNHQSILCMSDLVFGFLFLQISYKREDIRYLAILTWSPLLWSSVHILFKYECIKKLTIKLFTL